MIWLTWRQHRVEILIMGIALALFATVLLVTGFSIAAEAQQVGATTCVSNQSTCIQAQATLAHYILHAALQNQAFNLFCMVLPLALPVLVGMFIGAPAIARELEQGTYCLIWTQDSPWSRWFFFKVGLITCAVLCPFVMLFGLFSWWSGLVMNMPIIREGGLNEFSTFFDSWGLVAVAYALFALMLGMFVGTALRKAVPAMAITLVIFVIVRIVIVNVWRPSYLPPVSIITSVGVNVQMPAGSWMISEGMIDRQGQPLPPGAGSVCDALLSQIATAPQYGRCAKDHGFQYKTVYQPGDRFWLFQGIEGGIYLLMTIVLFGSTFWWMKYRTVGTRGRKRPVDNIFPRKRAIALRTEDARLSDSISADANPQTIELI